MCENNTTILRKPGSSSATAHSTGQQLVLTRDLETDRNGIPDERHHCRARGHPRRDCGEDEEARGGARRRISGPGSSAAAMEATGKARGVADLGSVSRGWRTAAERHHCEFAAAHLDDRRGDTAEGAPQRPGNTTGNRTFAEQRDYLFALWDAPDLGDNVTSCTGRMTSPERLRRGLSKG